MGTPLFVTFYHIVTEAISGIFYFMKSSNYFLYREMFKDKNVIVTKFIDVATYLKVGG